jgi:hypothetical protein
MGVAGANSDPNDVGAASGGKSSKADHWQEKALELDRGQFVAQPKIDIFGHAIEEAESKMHLIFVHPADPVDMRIKIDKDALQRIRHVDRDEEALRLHLSR